MTKLRPLQEAGLLYPEIRSDFCAFESAAE